MAGDRRPIEIAQIIARRLGLTGAMGTVAEHIDGVYTGRLVGDLLHGPAKGEAIKALAAREELDLAACSAYSDSFNDLPMLTMVGDPCAINPDARLRATRASRAGGSGTTAPDARRPAPDSWWARSPAPSAARSRRASRCARPPSLTPSGLARARRVPQWHGPPSGAQLFPRRGAPP